MKTDYLRVPDIMDLLQVSEITVRRYLRGGLVHSKVGGLVVVRREDLDAFVDQGRRKKHGKKIIRLVRRDSAKG